MDTLLTLLGVAGATFVMGVPGADDIMLNYQSTSFHDALYLREVLGPAPGAGVRGMAAPDGDPGRAGRVRPALQGAGGAANLLTYAEAAHHG